MPQQLEILATPTKSIKNLDHLGIVAGICDEIRLVQIIDELIPSNASQKVSHGVTLKSMIINSLGYTERTLYLSWDFYKDKPIEHLLGEGIKLSYLNDDRLGDTLDALYTYGVSKLFFHLSYHVHRYYNLKLVSKHLDGTTLSVSGKGSPNSSVVQVRRGYNKQGNHSLAQIVLELITNGNGGLPLFMSVHNGNETDKTAFMEVVEKYHKELSDVKLEDNSIWVADNALYTAENIQKMGDVLWLSRAGHSLKWVSLAYKESETKEWLNFKNHQGYKYQVIKTTYGGVSQAALIIYSADKYKKDVHSFNKKLSKEKAKYQKALNKASKIAYSSKEEALLTLETLSAKGNKYYKLSNHQVLEVEHYKRGRRTKNAQPIRYTYQIDKTKVQIIEKQDIIEDSKTNLGKFVLVTNEIHTKKKGAKLLKRSADELLKLYKNDQQKTERGFKFIKDPTFLLSHMFVTLPRRMVALAMLMCLSLLIYRIAEFKLRTSLKEKEETLPNQVGKQVSNPTMKWIFRVFKGIHIEQTHGKTYIVGLNNTHKKILGHLGACVSVYYGL